MESSSSRSILVPEMLLLGYRNGYFPMAESDTAEIFWHRPDPRAVIPLEHAHISSSTLKDVRKGRFRVTVDTAFEQTIRACAQRESSWISEEIIEAYVGLHQMGYAHSVESWSDGVLVGGLYGVHIGAAFFGESMFSTQSNASKVAFAYLVAILRANGTFLLDTQYINPFTASLGAIEISDADYQRLLADAIDQPVTFMKNSLP